MSLKDLVFNAQKQAMKNRDTQKVSVFRMLLSDVKKAEIDGQKELDDVSVQKIIAMQVKRLKDSIIDFTAGNRQDLVDSAEAEIDILKTYLPEQLSEKDLKDIIGKVISETKANGSSDIGKVMGEVMKKVQGVADGGDVRRLVTELLN